MTRKGIFEKFAETVLGVGFLALFLKIMDVKNG